MTLKLYIVFILVMGAEFIFIPSVSYSQTTNPFIVTATIINRRLAADSEKVTIRIKLKNTGTDTLYSIEQSCFSPFVCSVSSYHFDLVQEDCLKNIYEFIQFLPGKTVEKEIVVKYRNYISSTKEDSINIQVDLLIASKSILNKYKVTFDKIGPTKNMYVSKDTAYISIVDFSYLSGRGKFIKTREQLLHISLLSNRIVL